jgi:DNA topoisomerase-2
VEFILNQITRKLVEFIEKKKKVKVNPNSIKEQLILFVRCDIENPAFDSQTKDFMNTPSSKFGSTCTVSDKFIEKIAKMGVMDAACALTEVKENKAAKKTDGSKTKSIRGIPKLIDANWAGTEKSALCSIIFCEGDSAKAGIVSGLSSEDRNIIGVYPMKGKILNVRGEATKKIVENKEISEIKKILGLETGRVYKSMEDVGKSLRYGKVLFMTDQDMDGSHIKGLGINLFQSEWPSLTQIPGFIGFMNTPILKARKGNQELVFYNEGEYDTWKNSMQEHELKSWNIKYYKGLGTSTGKEFREYFEKKKTVGFEYKGKNSDDTIDMVFNKKRADDRKEWLGEYDRESFLDTNDKMVSYEEFINKELIHFSKYDCDRSIPNLMDGLKISLRKILYSAFKKNLTTEIKVAQFSGYVSEHSGYHHGEASLNAAIVGMAQNYVGSNNINLLMPNGQFGTRLQGGKDSASERYIFTQLNKITRILFPDADDKILSYLNDDGLLVEPIYYAPIIPMVLVNGSKGIGTGFSTDIMCYNPSQIIQYIKNKLTSTTSEIGVTEFTPYYEGFKGTIQKISEEGKYLFKGKYEKLGSDKIRVTELPVGYWTDDFKEYLETLTETVDKTGKKINPVVKEYDDMSKDTTVDFIVTLHKGKLAELEAVQLENGCNGLEKQFKLFNTNNSSNMHLFDAHDKLKKYEKVQEIIDDYFVTRIELYQKRKEYLIGALTQDLMLLSNKSRYITELLEGSIDLRRKKKEEVIQMLKDKKYNKINEDEDYKYLVKLPMDSVTEENVARLNKEHADKVAELEYVKTTTTSQMWLKELDVLEKEYNKYREARENADKVGGKTLGGSSEKKKVKKALLVTSE